MPVKELLYFSNRLKLNYVYDGNAKTRPGQTLVWNVENRLHSVAGETYLYDENGIRIKKAVGATTTLYPWILSLSKGGHYEVSGTTVKKYYTFGGMMVAMRTGFTLQYLHTDHLGGVAAVTDSAGVYSTNQSYFAYGKKRAGGTLPTTINYTGQRLDGSGLVYMNARYYDPLVGMFISPDTIVPDAGVLIDYNRFAYARGNSLKYNDPSGHCATIAVAGPPGLVIDLPCWSTVAPYAAVSAAAVAAPVAGMLAIDYVLNEPALDYPTPYPEAEIGEMGASFPLPDSNTLSIEGIPLVTEETYLLVTPDSGTSALSNNPGFTLSQPVINNNLLLSLLPSKPTGNLRSRNDQYWKNLGLSAHTLKQDVPGTVKHFDLYEDAAGYVWALRKGAKDSTAHYIDFLDDLIEDYNK